MALEVLDQHARVVKAHGLVVEQAAPELDGMVQLHPRGLVRRSGKSGGVRPAESIDGKALDGREQLVGDFARDAVGQAPADELVLERRHLDSVEVSRHRSAKTVGATRSHARDIHRDLDDLLLVEDHPERVFEDRLEQRMRVGDRLTALLAPDVGMDGVALDRAWPDDRHFDDQVVEGLRPGPGQRLHLSARLDLKHADRVRGAAHVEHSRVFQRQLVEVWPRAGRVLDQVQRLGHDRKRAKAEHVHLDETEVFDIVLVELDDPPSLHSGRLDGRDVDQRLAGDEHASVVDREVARKFDHLAAELEELLPALRAHVGWWNGPEHRVLDVFGEPAVDALGQPVE